MAKKTDNSPPQLVRDKEELKEMVNARLVEGEALLDRAVLNVEEKQALWADFRAWDIKNHELIATSFDVNRHKHEYQYEYRSPVTHEAVNSLLNRGPQRQKSFPEEVENDRSQIKVQLAKLRSFYDIIDLQHYAPSFQPVQTPKASSDLANIMRLLNQFHKVANKLRDRYNGRDTIILNDEYDVQDLLYGLLHIYFGDIRKEDYSPSLAGANSRIDFVLKMSGIIVEAKMASDSLRDKRLGEELLVDIGRYKGYPDCKTFVIFIYDKGDNVANKHGLIRDLEQQSTPQFKVICVINPL